MAITVRLYSETGEKGTRVGLALRKADVGARLLRALQDAEQMKKGGFTVTDLDRLDSGELPMSKIASLYTPQEIKEAIQRRMTEIDREGEELSALSAMLHTTLFTAAQGGERARSRENEMINDWKNVVSTRKSRSSDGDIFKSARVGSASDIVTGFSWEPSNKGRDTRGPLAYIHGEHPGVEIRIGPESAWTMLRGAKELAKSQGKTPLQNAAALLAKLSEFHER